MEELTINDQQWRNTVVVFVSLFSIFFFCLVAHYQAIKTLIRSKWETVFDVYFLICACESEAMRFHLVFFSRTLNVQPLQELKQISANVTIIFATTKRATFEQMVHVRNCNFSVSS